MPGPISCILTFTLQILPLTQISGAKFTVVEEIAFGLENIAIDTPIVLLDEPTTGQDAVNAARIAHIVRTLREQGKTVIAISHDIDSCAENFNRIVAMGDGAILLDGPPRDVLVQEATLPPPTWTRPNSPGWAADSDLPTRPPPSAQKGERRASAWAKTSTRIIS